MFPRSERLRKSADIQHVVTHGSRAQTSSLRAYWLNRGSSEKGPAFVTVVVGKKVHKSAVIRNRLKRRVRSAVRQLPLPSDINIVLLPRIDVLKMPFEQLKTELEKIHHEMVK